MTHKTFRDLTTYEKGQRDKIASLLQEASKFTLEEVMLFQSALNHLVWYSFQKVEEKDLINQNTENVEELI